MDQKIKRTMKELFKLMIVSCMIISCQQGQKDKNQETGDRGEIVRGELILGHEVESFTPSNSDLNYWIIDSSKNLKKAYDSLTINAKYPYMPVFAELKIVDKGKSTEGFAAEYDGVYEVIEIINIRNLKESEIQSTYEVLTGSDGSKLELLYKTDGEKPTVIITSENYGSQILTQTEAWAKGAEYANETMTWVTKPNGGELQVDGKSLFFENKE